MEALKIILLTLLVTVALGCIVGVALGKHAVKRATSNSKPLLSVTERIVYAGLLLAGCACIVIGIFLVPKPAADIIDDGMMGYEDGMMVFGPDDEFGDGAEMPGEDLDMEGAAQEDPDGNGEEGGEEDGSGEEGQEDGAETTGESDATEPDGVGDGGEAAAEPLSGEADSPDDEPVDGYLPDVAIIGGADGPTSILIG